MAKWGLLIYEPTPAFSYFDHPFLSLVKFILRPNLTLLDGKELGIFTGIKDLFTDGPDSRQDYYSNMTNTFVV